MSNEADDEDAELAAAIALSLDLAPSTSAIAPPVDGNNSSAPTQPQSNTPAGRTTSSVESQALNNLPSKQSFVFESFKFEDIQVEADAAQKANQLCQESGEEFIDGQFPATKRSLYVREEDATSWTCLTCNGRTEFPPPPPLAENQEELEQQGEYFQQSARCIKCNAPPPFEARIRYVHQPAGWLRPRELRDSLSETTVGTPWVLVGSSSATDVCQGGLGNCWFVGALSVIARHPELIKQIFEGVTEVNPNGVYQMRLCHAGEWCRILIDDRLPVCQVSEGHANEGQTQNSRGGTLCYIQCAKRQLWAPLVEKAAAKLYGSYEILKGGNSGEALALLTGFPVQRIKLYEPKLLRQRRAQYRQARQAQRQQLSLQGRPVPPHLQHGPEDEPENDDAKWGNILAACEKEYLMCMGCTEEGCEKTKRHIVAEMGLQTPHAYSILDARDVEVNGRFVRLLKVRNPWGDRAICTWKGAWGKDSNLWTPELKRKLGVVDSSGNLVDNELAVFWMAFEDAKEYFQAVEICRVHLRWHEARLRCWLPSGVGPGEAFELTVFQKTQVDLVLWQERHITREGAVAAKSTHVDIGFAVLRRRGDGRTSAAWDLVQYVPRTRHDDVSVETTLEGGYVYRIMPLSFCRMQEMSPRRAVLAVHSMHKVELKKITPSWRDVAVTVSEASRIHGRGKAMERGPPGLWYSILHEEVGTVLTVENKTDMQVAMRLDASASVGCLSTRGDLDFIAAVPPKCRQVLLVLALQPGAPHCKSQLSANVVPSAALDYALPGEGLHEALPFSAFPVAGIAAPPPDATILQQAPREDVGSRPSGPSKEEMQVLVKAIFAKLVASGMPANEAAVKAMAQAQQSQVNSNNQQHVTSSGGYPL